LIEGQKAVEKAFNKFNMIAFPGRFKIDSRTGFRISR